MTKREAYRTIAWLILFGLAVLAFRSTAEATVWKSGKVDLVVKSDTLRIYAINGHIDDYYLKEAILHPIFKGISTIESRYYNYMGQTWVTIECWEGCTNSLFDEAVAAEIGMAAKTWGDSHD